MCARHTYFVGTCICACELFEQINYVFVYIPVKYEIFVYAVVTFENRNMSCYGVMMSLTVSFVIVQYIKLHQFGYY